MRDRISQGEIRKDALQDTVEATASAVSAVKPLRVPAGLTRQVPVDVNTTSTPPCTSRAAP